jgi:hypothetical protein
MALEIVNCITYTMINPETGQVEKKQNGFSKVSNFALWLCLAPIKSLFLPILSQ